MQFILKFSVSLLDKFYKIMKVEDDVFVPLYKKNLKILFR